MCRTLFTLWHFPLCFTLFLWCLTLFAFVNLSVVSYVPFAAVSYIFVCVLHASLYCGALSVYMSVSISVCVRACVHAACVRACVRECVRVCVARKGVCRLSACARVSCVFVFVCVFACVCVCVCVYACHVCVCVYVRVRARAPAHVCARM